MSNSSIPVRKFDAVIVGAGGSGLRAAIQLSEGGLKTAVLSKVFPTRSHTVAAQGGVSASLGNSEEDHWHWHMYDTVKGSDWLGDQDAIEYMCRKAPEVVVELEHFGMPFDRTDEGKIYQRPFGGHMSNFGEKPVRRACAAADRTGHAMLHALYQRNVRANTQFFVEWMALDLIRDESGQVLGVIALEMETGEVVAFHAKATIFATGGAGRIYYSSTNAFINTGDGLGMAARAGIALEDMEFWQFHPTGVAGAGVLITEGVRGEGGILRNSDNERFMERYAPNAKDLASRDVVSRAMVTEINEGRGCGPNKDFVLLDITHLDPATIMKRLPGIREISIQFAGIDPIQAPIPVVPTCHYQMGGIPTNFKGQVVSADGVPVKGFYAAGEVACASVHGANRLGTNSLLDLLVFGKSSGDSVIEDLASGAIVHKDLPAAYAERTLARLHRLNTQTGGSNVNETRLELQRTMQKHCGVFRFKDMLVEGVAKIVEIEKAVARTEIKDKSQVWNTARVEALELDNLIEVAKATLVSAEARKESRGAHVRDDAPDTPENPNGRDDVNWHKHTLWEREGSSLSYKPVTMTPLTVETIALKTRSY
ncbi:MAG: succinate dehydrogenase flavoprotein subunit [Candidatus Accumulibacter sp.]|uniref:succinate dehydrogenase flavoprotein subunit n=1 Tax=unclassified Candidatus Accumulibacter TaxID=2619054 RepID=UPI0012C56C71|nr:MULTISPECIES: succinate dehydrogenase flavoprotein subunit [unclassified Candidatus Accumulibacter]MQM35066.1 succinate dehydrogenase flavoprotein subunit [Candidatus Accumulibacter phosphatis]MBL8369243.1 succinate dehydrogenase flavoprotein subunit [Accumulibacter sp.]MBN8515530.1 succinate dehydrogenase flavoprotein subunit [Accumulibacter sp.]MBO3703957.1 succinate dehydrogenase flavoprotein subunit [Accumulibacter sp.]HRI91749.1 succinate dehydrogenase flavoprotein subunit [Accumulibac